MPAEPRERWVLGASPGATHRPLAVVADDLGAADQVAIPADLAHRTHLDTWRRARYDTIG